MFRSILKMISGSVLKSKWPKPLISRNMADIMPRTQYDIPTPKTFKWEVLCDRWELIPTAILCVGDILFVYAALVYFAFNKTELRFARNSQTLAESMDLCNPTKHKWVMSNQEYLPWPEIAEVLADMDDEQEKRVKHAYGTSH